MVLEAGTESKQVREMFKELGSKDSLRRVMVERKAVDSIAQMTLRENSSSPSKSKPAKLKTKKTSTEITKTPKRSKQ